MFNDTELLLAWERGYGRPPFEQALVLLSVVSPNTAADDLMNLSIGKRDAALLELRKQLFGAKINSLANCPTCNETLELSFSVDDITVQEQTTGSHRVEFDGVQVDFHPPTSRDLLSLKRTAVDDRTEQLLARCVTRVQRDEQQVNLSELSPQTRFTISQAIADSDPQADIQLALACRECGNHWSSAFDVVGFLWAELNIWSQRLLAEIHVLAKAYGWTEPEALALSRWRRQVYLSMVRQ